MIKEGIIRDYGLDALKARIQGDGQRANELGLAKTPITSDYEEIASRQRHNDGVGKLQANIQGELQRINELELAKPPIAPGYETIAARLLLKEKRGVSVFNGGPLDYRGYGMQKAWVQPVEVKDKKGFSNFHLLYLNCTPGTAQDASVNVSFARDIGLKTGDTQDPEVQALHNAIVNGDPTPQIIIRPSMVGSLYYPRILDPLHMPTPEVLKKRFTHLVKTLQLPLDTDAIDPHGFSSLTREFELYAEYPQFVLGTPEKIHSEGGDVWAYQIVAPDDPWIQYQIFTDKLLERMDKHAPTVLRTDSGCDAGHLYRDHGCDCRDQFIKALQDIHRGDDVSEGGIVLHIPSQDGRGYGTNTKMETEGLKRGEQMIFNRGQQLKEMDTVHAAELVFQKTYDIRTYDGAARVLKQLGFRTIILHTDNRVKLESLRAAGLEVERRPTETRGNGFNDQHIHAKHLTNTYFS